MAESTASGGVCTAANPSGETTSPLIEVESKKIADQVIARQKDGQNNSTCKANCHGEVQTGTSSPPITTSAMSQRLQNEYQAAQDTLKQFGSDSQQYERAYGVYTKDITQNAQASTSPPDVTMTHWPNLSEIPTYSLNKAAEGAGTAIDVGSMFVGEPEVAIGRRALVAAGKRILFRKTEKVVSEPISVATGEYLETWQDFFIPATLALDGARYMGLKLPLPDHYASPLGPCQISTFDQIVSNSAPGQIDLHQADGKRVSFDRPFNFLSSQNPGYPHLKLRAPWLKQLELRDRELIKHFRQYDDRIYRLEKIEDLNGNVITFRRSGSGVLESADGTNGLALAFSNDAHGRRTGIRLVGTDGSQIHLARYAYDTRGRMTGADCAFGMSVRYYWHPKHDLLLRWHNTTGRSEAYFTYDDEGRVLQARTNGIWNDDRFCYTPKKRKTTYLPSGDEHSARSFVYDENYNVTEETDVLGNSVHYTFDEAGFEIATRDANGHTTTKAYDNLGNVRQLTDAEGRSTVYAWGPHGALDMAIDGAGNIRRWANDERGNTVTETDAEGHDTSFVHDERGRLLRIIFPDGTEENRSYDVYDRLASVTDARGSVTHFTHDVFGRVVTRSNALGHITRTEYAAGAGGFATETAIIRPDGVRVRRAYADDGVLASLTDGEGRTWRYEFGAFAVLDAIEDPGGGRLKLSRDSEGRVVCVTNQIGATYQLIRDAAGQVIAEEDFDGRRTEYERDPGGRVIETRKPDGARLVHGYDRTDRLTSLKTYSASAFDGDAPADETYFWYDRRGLLIKASNSTALVEFVLDGNGRVVRETINGRSIDSTLDKLGNRIERWIGRDRPGGGLVKTAYDPIGMVASVAIDNHAPLAFTRDALGREIRRISSEGFCLEQLFDDASQLVRQRVGNGDDCVERRYSWDKAGAPTCIKDIKWGDTRYTYDANGQIAKAEFGDEFTEKFSYNAAKNVTGVSLLGPGLEASAARLFSCRATLGGVVQLTRGPTGEMVALTHDVCGRVVKRRVDCNGFRPRIWHYTWDAHDRLVRCENPDGETWFYGYDPFGRRLTKVRKLAERELAWTATKFPHLVTDKAREETKIWTWPEPPKATSCGDLRPPVVGFQYMWDGDVIASQAPLRLDGTIDWDDQTQWYYEADGFIPMARKSSDGKLDFITTDHLGTPREIFSEHANRRWTASLTTWGVGRSAETSSSPVVTNDGSAIYPRPPSQGNLALKIAAASAYECPIRFQGQWADEETGLYYNRNRYYDPLAAQYASPDPTGLYGGERPQGYVESSTIDIDALGLKAARMASNKAAGDAIRDVIAKREAPALTEQYFKTVGGGRRVDVLKLGDKRIAIESKVGRTGLGKRERQELARDWWLRRQGKVDGVQWEFSPSGVNGGVGPVPSLQQKLDNLGFTTRINP